MTYTILVADPKQGVVEDLEACLEDGGYTVRKASSGADELDLVLQDNAALVMDSARRTCMYMGKELHLTPKEFDILWELAEAQGKVVKNSDMYKAVWGEEYYQENDNTIAVHIRRLRKKMAAAGVPEANLSIETAWGSGYKLSYSLTGVDTHSQKSRMLL